MGRGKKGLTRAGELPLLADLAADNLAGAGDPQQNEGIVITARRVKKTESIIAVRTARDAGKQAVGYSSRPFVLCGLPIKRPRKGTLIHVRRNGKFFLRVAGDAEFGLPFGQDRLIPIWVATLAVLQGSRTVRFRAAAELLDAFGLAKDGRTYRRLVEGFRRVFTSTIFFGTEEQLQRAAVWDWTRFHFFDRMTIWFSKDIEQPTLPSEGFENVIELSAEFWRELSDHPIPIDMTAVRALTDSPGCLDFYMWLCWRCWAARGESRVPLFGPGGLAGQLGVEGYANRRNFRVTLRRWLLKVGEMWPDCPAEISEDGEHLVIAHSKALPISTVRV